MHRLTRRVVAAGAAMTLAALGTTAAQAHTVGEPGDETMLVHLNDSEAGGSYHQTFELVYDEAATGRHARLHLRPRGGARQRRRRQPRPGVRPEPGRRLHTVRRQLGRRLRAHPGQIDHLGDELTNQIVPVDEAHFGDIGTAVGEDGTSSDALVMLVYNVQDESYYDCCGQHLHGRLLRARVHRRGGDERHRHRRLRLGQPDR